MKLLVELVALHAGHGELQSRDSIRGKLGCRQRRVAGTVSTLKRDELDTITPPRGPTDFDYGPRFGDSDFLYIRMEPAGALEEGDRLAAPTVRQCVLSFSTSTFPVSSTTKNFCC